MEEKMKAILIRISSRDRQISPWNLDNFSEDQIIELSKMVEWIFQEYGENRGIEILTDALQDMDEENIKLFLQKITEAFNFGGQKEIVYPNAIGFLLKSQDEYNNEILN